MPLGEPDIPIVVKMRRSINLAVLVVDSFLVTIIESLRNVILLSKCRLPFLEEVIKQEHGDQSVHSCSTDPAGSNQPLPIGSKIRKADSS